MLNHSHKDVVYTNADERRFVNLNIQHLSEVYQGNSLIKSLQNITTIIFASFAHFAVRFINSLNELSSIAQPSVFIGVHPRSIYRTAPAEGR